VPGVVFPEGLTSIEGVSSSVDSSTADKMTKSKEVVVALTYKMGYFPDKTDSHRLRVGK